ncbi:hypothetical protein MRB53_039551 [Persea americana]|nr:hypothetical protein MRB53_039551 [Persea americana]
MTTRRRRRLQVGSARAAKKVSRARRGIATFHSLGQSGTLHGLLRRWLTVVSNECKRRKIKCNGETPCKRCGNLSLDCVYAPELLREQLQGQPVSTPLAAHR